MAYKEFLGEEYEPVNFDDTSDQELSSMLSSCDRNLVLSFADRIVNEPDSHKYDKYDETRINELPLPTYCTYDEAVGIIDEFKKEVRKCVDAYNDGSGKRKVYSALTTDWSTVNYVARNCGDNFSNFDMEELLNELYNDVKVDRIEVKHVDDEDFCIYRKRHSKGQLIGN